MAGKKQAQAWQNRIVGEGVERPDQLLANPSNWRIHPKHQQDALSAVLDNVGWVQRVIINRTTGHIVDGHLRVLLADRRGETEVPVLYVDLTPDEELTILATIDPLSAMAATDSAKLAELLASVQTDDAALEAVLRGVGETAGLDMGGAIDEAPEVDVDRAEELRAKWGVETGDLWRVQSKHGGEHRILCGDSTNAADVARVMGGASIVLINTDPPYGVDYHGQNDSMFYGKDKKGVTRAKLVDDDTPANAFELISKSIELVGAQCLFLWHAPQFHSDVMSIVSRLKWITFALIVWNKNHANFGAMGACYKPKYEMAIAAKRTTIPWYGPDNETTVWDIDRNSVNEFHPTQKPAELFARAIRNHTDVQDGVYDPFLGSGTTAVACEQLARRCYGIEISPAYVSVTLERLSLMGLSPEREAADG
jgi:DNA modification methylase